MYNSGTAYLLWVVGLFGVCGLHRFYANKPVSGIFWLCTFGVCFVGQLVDLFLIPGLITEANANAQGHVRVSQSQRHHGS